MSIEIKEPGVSWKKKPPMFMPWAKQPCASVWEHNLVAIRVIRSIATLRDGSKWIHVSVSRPNRIPDWQEYMRVKNDFLGEDVEAYQVLPAKRDYVNLCEYALHMWAPLDGQRRVANLQDLVDEEAI